MVDRPLYEPDPKWSAPATEAFLCYREMGGERSIRNVAERLDKSRQIVGQWSARYNWAERVAAFDAHMAETTTTAREEAMADQGYKEGVAAAKVTILHDMVLTSLIKDFEDALAKGEDPMAGMTKQQKIAMSARLTAALKDSQFVGRLARGEETDRPGSTGVEEWTTDRLQAYLLGREDARREREGVKT